VPLHEERSLLTSPRPNGTGLEKYLTDYKYMNFPSIFMSICSNTMAHLIRRRPVKRKVPGSNPTCLRNITFFNPKKNLRKESWQRFKWYNQMAQVGKVGTSGTSGTGRSGSPDLRGTSGTRTRGSSDRRGTSGTRTRGLSS